MRHKLILKKNQKSSNTPPKASKHEHNERRCNLVTSAKPRYKKFSWNIWFYCICHEDEQTVTKSTKSPSSVYSTCRVEIKIYARAVSRAWKCTYVHLSVGSEFVFGSCVFVCCKKKDHFEKYDRIYAVKLFSDSSCTLHVLISQSFFCRLTIVVSFISDIYREIKNVIHTLKI